jgi:hypothetical protein
MAVATEVNAVNAVMIILALSEESPSFLDVRSLVAVEMIDTYE